MKKYLFLLLALTPFYAFADGTDPTQVVIPTGDALMQIMQLIGGVKGATGLGLALIIGKILMAVFQSDLVTNFFVVSLKDIHGKYKFAVVSLLTLALAVLAQMQAGQTLVAALLNGSVLTMASVYFNQFYKQFFTKPV